MKRLVWMVFIDFLLLMVIAIITNWVLTLKAADEVAKADVGNIIDKSEFLIEMTWENGSTNDVDLWIANPVGDLCSYQRKDIGLMTLDRDDLGITNNRIETENGTIENNSRREVGSIRGVIPGRYVINTKLYGKKAGPSEVTITIRKLNPYREILTKKITLTDEKEEKTIASIDIDKDGNVVSVDQITQEVLSTRGQLK
ncbi:hypothetical protein EVB91_123 [Rhizobium phage RHph_I1_18]|nr:hypothetical protein EVB91_123 [Rhizobium phage RHph_I1_18]